jgi:hypothetical protein
MKFAIFTIHTAFNYGAMLQAYALQFAISKLGYDVKIVDYYPKEVEDSNFMRIIDTNPKTLLRYIYAKLNPNVQKKIRRFDEFRNHMQLTKRYISKNELYQNPPEFDVYIVGSDQIWNLEQGFISLNFLDFVNDKLKLSYASSFGTATIKKEYFNELTKQLKNFISISVRESDGVDIIKQATGLDSKQVLDPTFLLKSDEWDLISKLPTIEGEYIFCYGFDGSTTSRIMVESIQKRLGLPIVAVTTGMSIPFKVDYFIQEAGPLEFLGLIKNAKFVCTSSYHGMALAINYRRSFIATIHPTRNSRMESMLNVFGLENRQIENPKDILNFTDKDLFIDYSYIETKINEAIYDSISWLESALSSCKKI